MAETLTQKNPRLIKSNHPMEKQYVLTEDSKTWYKGQFGAYSSGVATPIATNATSIQVVFLSDQTTSSSSTYCWVGLITSDMIFEGFELDSAVTAAIMEQQGVDVSNNLVTVDGGNTNYAVKVVDIASQYEPARNKSDDIKARLRFKVLTSAIEA